MRFLRFLKKAQKKKEAAAKSQGQLPESQKQELVTKKPRRALLSSLLRFLQLTSNLFTPSPLNDPQKRPAFSIIR
jgi:hypothetical protein